MTFPQYMRDGQAFFTAAVMGWVVVHYVALFFGASIFPISGEFILAFAAMGFVLRPFILYLIE